MVLAINNVLTTLVVAIYTVNSQQSTVNSQQSTVNSQQSTTLNHDRQS
ncbi:MAG: hypothetical protein JGK01_18150 [Microcoleus sp. PH2017_03_ELD_O_A]|nr:hypothetical protein [Microcoleus sp. PH2017_03_ELD_O_A]